MTKYPRVLSEDETMRQVLAGASIARYGDGEFKLCRDSGIKNHDFHPVLARRLREILIDAGSCLVGIPNIHEVVAQHVSDQKVAHWTKYMPYCKFLVDRPYVSSFITRPDSAPWIHRPDYWQAMETLWIDQDVTLVRGSGKSLTADDVLGARTVTEIIGPRRSAFTDYDDLMARVCSVNPRRVLLGLGPAATVMAADLCARGIHALDLGHAAMFLRKFRRSEPMQVTPEEKAQEAYPS